MVFEGVWTSHHCPGSVAKGGSDDLLHQFCLGGRIDDSESVSGIPPDQITSGP